MHYALLHAKYFWAPHVYISLSYVKNKRICYLSFIERNKPKTLHVSTWSNFENSHSSLEPFKQFRWHFRFSRRRVWTWLPSEMLRRMVCEMFTNISEVCLLSFRRNIQHTSLRSKPEDGGDMTLRNAGNSHTTTRHHGLTPETTIHVLTVRENVRPQAIISD
jgi:hypothetical protein